MAEIIEDAVLIETNRLYLRRLEETDLPYLEQLFCDSAMMEYLGGPWTKEMARETLEEWRDQWRINNYCYGCLIRKDTAEVIGTAGFTENTIADEPGIEFSWFILPSQQRKGFASEVTGELLRHVFDTLGKDRIVAETHPENRASNRVLEKLNFRKLGERDNQYDYLPGFDKQVLWEFCRTSWVNSI